MSEELDPLSFRYQKALAPLARLSKDASVGKRIVEAAREIADLPAKEVVGRLVGGIRSFAAEAGLIDDLTLVVLRRL